MACIAVRFWSDWMNTEKAGGYTTMDLNLGFRLGEFSPWLTKPEIKFNITQSDR